MQNARVIQLGSSNVKVTRNSASFDEAFGGYSSKRKQKFSNVLGDTIHQGTSLYDFSVKGDKGTVKTFSKNSIIPIAFESLNNKITVMTKVGDEKFFIDPSFMINPLNTNSTLLLKPINPSNDSAPFKSDFAKLYKPIYDLKSVGSLGTTKYFPKGIDVLAIRSYKNKPNGVLYDIKVTHTAPNGEIFELSPDFVQTVGSSANALGKIMPILTTENKLLYGSGSGSSGATSQTYTFTEALNNYNKENVGRLTTNNPLMPILFGSYKVVSDANGINIGKADDGTTKTFPKDSIVSAYLQPFSNPSTVNNGKKSAYWIVDAEVPSTSANSSTQTSSTSNNAPKTTMINKKFKLYLKALGENIVPTNTNTSGGGNTDPNQGGGTNTGGGNYDPNQGGGVYTGGGNSSADLDALNAQIEAQQMAQYQQQGGVQQQNNTSLEDLNAQVDAENQAQMMQQGSSGYEPTQDELMVDIDTNYAPDTQIESSFDGYGNSNAMETMIKDLCTKIAWNKEMAEMLKTKKGVDKSELKAEYVAKVDRVNELLRELKSYETPANREYIQKMLNYCDMMRPSKKRTMPKQMVIQNTNPKVISLGNTTPSEFKNDLGNTIMEDENSSFMGEVIDYSAFNGSSTSTALIGVGIGAVLGIIGIVVIKKMNK
jgi:hypothetical protein